VKQTHTLKNYAWIYLKICDAPANSAGHPGN